MLTAIRGRGRHAGGWPRSRACSIPRRAGWARSGGAYGKLAGALCGLLAGFCPAIFKALNLDLHLEGIHRDAGAGTNLRDRFRRAATVTSHAGFDEFKAEFEALMDRMDAARTAAPPAPEWCFKAAQKKIGKGDYDFDVDLPPGQGPNGQT